MFDSLWLDLYLFCFVANLAVVFMLFGRSKLNGRLSWLKLVGAVFSVASILVLTVDGIQLLQGFQFRKFHPWINFPLIAVSIVVSWLTTHSFTTNVKSPLRHHFVTGVLAVAFVGLNCWSMYRLKNYAIEIDFSCQTFTTGRLAQETRVIGMTLAGSRIPLYRLDVRPEDFRDFAMASKESTLRMADPVINIEDPDMNYNCHGWVFTGGKHFLKGSEVELILKENGYEPITQPKENDIVIYRSLDGRILHTGLVRTVLTDGTILIESKWGASGRYLHRTEHQPYSELYEYYRGCRPTHVIQLTDVPTTEPKILPTKMASASW